MNSIFNFASAAIIAAVLTIAAQAATFNVNSFADTQDINPGNGVCADSSGQCSLRAAITETNALAGADVINLPAGTYTQGPAGLGDDLNLSGDWDIRDSLTINGADRATTFVEAKNNSGVGEKDRVIDSVLTGNIVTIRNVTVRRGSIRNIGGGIRNVGNMTVDNIVVSTNGADHGAGIYSEGPMTITNSLLEFNNCFTTTAAECFGGGAYLNAAAAGTAFTVTDTMFHANLMEATGPTTKGYGAALAVNDRAGGSFTLNINGSSFTESNLALGPGDTGLGNTLSVLVTTNASTVGIEDSHFFDNGGSGSPIYGGAIALLTTGTGSLSADLERLRVNNNHVNGDGGGIYLRSEGGALNVNIRSSAIYNNRARDNGGGIAVTNQGGSSNSTITFNLANTTVSGNTASVLAGGGIYVNQIPGPLVNTTLDFCTIYDNEAETSGGGIRKTAGLFTIKSSIVGGNIAPVGTDMSGSFVTLNYNLFQDTSGSTITGVNFADIVGIPPQLGPLQANGSTRFTHLPALFSAVMNSIPLGHNGCGTEFATDQRGVARPRNGRCERGAAEVDFPVTGPWAISGTVRTSGGNPLRNVLVTISGGELTEPISMFTGSFGGYSFANLPGGAYTVTVATKRNDFSPDSRQIVLESDTSNFDFFAVDAARQIMKRGHPARNER